MGCSPLNCMEETDHTRTFLSGRNKGGQNKRIMLNSLSPFSSTQNAKSHDDLFRDGRPAAAACEILSISRSWIMPNEKEPSTWIIELCAAPPFRVKHRFNSCDYGHGKKTPVANWDRSPDFTQRPFHAAAADERMNAIQLSPFCYFLLFLLPIILHFGRPFSACNDVI